MPAPYYPGVQPPPGGELREILLRLDLIERKIDWIARRVAAPEPSAAAPVQPAQPERPAQPEQSARPERPKTPAPDTATERHEPAAAEPASAKAPAATSTAVPRPADTPRPAAVPPAAWRPAHVPQTQPQPAVARASTVPGAYGRPHDAAQRPPSPTDPSSTAWNRARSEGNIGRYLLSGAAAVLVVLAAVSLIALVWDSIPDTVKVGSLMAVAVGLVVSGTVVARRSRHLQVAAATLTGTGGALGFVAVIGAVLLKTGMPIFAAFGLMAAWSVVLLITARATSQIFTAVVSGMGTLVTIGFASWHAGAHPDTASLTWPLVCLDVLALAAITAYLARSSPSMRLAPWFPATAVPATLAALLLTPARTLAEEHESLCALLMLFPVVLVGAQVLDAGPRLHRAGWQWVSGVDWALVGLTAVTAQLRLVSLLGPASEVGRHSRLSGVEHYSILVDAGAMGIPLLVAAGSALLLILGASQAWCTQVTPVHLAVTVVVGLVSCVVQIRSFPVVVAMLATALVLHARQGRPFVLPVMAASGLVVLAGTDQGDTTSRVCALIGLVLVPAGTVVLERVLKRVPPARPDGGPEQDAGTRDTAARREGLTAASWLLTLDLAVILPVLLFQAMPSSERTVAISTLAAGVIAIALVRLGLVSSAPTPTALLTGAAAGQRAGVDAGAPTAPMPPAPLWGGYLAMAFMSLVQLACAMLLSALVWQMLLVAVALGAGTTAAWLLWPWLRRPVETLAAAGLLSALVWWSIRVLAGERMSGVFLTVVLLTTGAVCIVAGFRLRATMLRHYGLVLVLVSVLKLAVMDIGNQSSITRIIALGVAGLVCFGLSLAYNRIAADDSRDSPPSSRPVPPVPPVPPAAPPAVSPGSYGAAPQPGRPAAAEYGHVDGPTGPAGAGRADDTRFQPPR